MNVLETEWWTLAIPPEWWADSEEDSILVGDRDEAMGLLHVRGGGVAREAGPNKLGEHTTDVDSHGTGYMVTNLNPPIYPHPVGTVMDDTDLDAPILADALLDGGERGDDQSAPVLHLGGSLGHDADLPS